MYIYVLCLLTLKSVPLLVMFSVPFLVTCQGECYYNSWGLHLSTNIKLTPSDLSVYPLFSVSFSHPLSYFFLQ